MDPTTIQIIRGTDQNFELTFTDESGNAIDLTGQAVFFTVKLATQIDEKDLTDSDALFTTKVTNHSNPTGGITNVVMTNQQTLIPAGNYLYDIKLVTAGGTVSSVKAGEFDVMDPVTNRKS